MGVESHSEFEGGGLMPNTVFPKGSDALTPSDKLRLQSITGQDTDSQAPVNPYHWYGNVIPDDSAERFAALQEAQRKRALRRSEIDRYRETK